MKASTCSCGSAEAHTVAKRRTFDGLRVAMWCDGAITGGFGVALAGVPVARPRSADATDIARTAGWMFMAEAELCEADELPALYEACRWAAARGLDVAAMRARLHAAAPIDFTWTVTEADHRGDVRERMCRLNRMQWPGLAVIHSARGYQVMSISRVAAPGMRSGEEVMFPTGFVFQSQRDLCAYLRSCSAVAS